MSVGRQPRRRVPSALLVGLLVGSAALVLGLSYTLPTVTFRTITAKEPEVYSIWGGIVSLWRDGNVVLAPIVFLFSIVFPIAKLVLLGWTLFVSRRAARLGAPPLDAGLLRFVEWLRHVGKWSMLDVLIIALFVGSIRIGLATASSLAGIHVFTAAIVLSMLASAALARRLQPAAGARVPEVTVASGAWLGVGRLVSLACCFSLAVALAQPLLVVSKALFFSNEVALWSTARAMVSSGERALGSCLLLCVVALPVLRALVGLCLWWLPTGSPRLLRLARALDDWAMLDVLALALAIVHVKLAELATTRLLPGFWAVYVAGVLTVLDAWLVRRRDSMADRGAARGRPGAARRAEKAPRARRRGRAGVPARARRRRGAPGK
jgi:paraquat-inducible protein A